MTLINKRITIWGRKFDLKFIFDVYQGENNLDIQKDAVEIFVKESKDLLSSSKKLESYCIKQDSDWIGDRIDNTFKYVLPQVLL